MARAPRPTARPAVTLPVKPVATLSKVVVAATASWTALIIGLAVASPAVVAELTAGTPGPGVTTFGLLRFAWSIVLLFTYVVTCRWLLRARINSQAVDPSVRHQRGLSWTWIGWVFPVLNLWFPFQVVRDTARASHAPVSRGLLRGWWGCWLGSLYVAALVSERTSRAVPDLNLLVQLYAVAAVLTLAAAVLWVQIVRRITLAQADLTPGTKVTFD